MKQPRSKWRAIVQCGVFPALFVWLRWYSPFWQNRWTGFCLGAAFVLTDLNWREAAQSHLEFARKYDFPKRATIVPAIAITIIGAIGLGSFFVGPPFLFSSGVRAGSDTGLFGVFMCATAPSYVYAAWLRLRKDPVQSSHDPVLPPSHGR